MLDIKLAGEKEISEWIVDLIKPLLSENLKYKYLNLNKSTDIKSDLKELDVNELCRHLGFDTLEDPLSKKLIK